MYRKKYGTRIICAGLLCALALSGCGESAELPGGPAGVQPTQVAVPGADPGDSRGEGNTPEPGNDTQPGNAGEPGDDTQPGDDTRPGDDTQPGDDARPGNDAQPGNAGEPGNAAKPEVTPLSSQRIALSRLPKYVFQTGDGHLLLLGDTVTLMEEESLEIKESNDNPGLDFSFRNFLSCEFSAVGEEYVVLGSYQKMESPGDQGSFSVSFGSENPQLMLVRFDKKLKVLETLNLSEMTGTVRVIDSYKLTDDGKKLIYADMDGFYQYDLGTGRRTEYTADSKFKGVSSFGLLAAENKLLFTGVFDNGSGAGGSYPRTLGTVGLDGSDFRYEKEQAHNWGKVWCFDNFALIEDQEWYGPGDKGSVFYRGSDGKINAYPLPDEYTALQPSREGNLFAVKSRSWDEEGNSTGYIVRLYDSHTGRLLQETDCPLSEIGEDAMLWQCIVCERTGRLLLLISDIQSQEDAYFKVADIRK